MPESCLGCSVNDAGKDALYPVHVPGMSIYTLTQMFRQSELVRARNLIDHNLCSPYPLMVVYPTHSNINLFNQPVADLPGADRVVLREHIHLIHPPQPYCRGFK
jgi:hypothetical protein